MSKDNDYINFMLEKNKITRVVCEFVTLHVDGSLTLHTDPTTLTLPCFDQQRWEEVGYIFKPITYRWKWKK